VIPSFLGDSLGGSPELLHVLMLPDLEPAAAIGAASDRSRTQSEGRVTFRTRSSFVAACPAATTDPNCASCITASREVCKFEPPLPIGMAALDRVVRL
jgi:hypothetical protein